ncbi:kinesin-related protein 4-like, partial [Asbolus verrucosus]
MKLLEKRTSFFTEYIANFAEVTSGSSDNESDGSYNLSQDVRKKLREINTFLEVFNEEKESFQREIEENEKYFLENMSYLHGLVDYFRESLFEELDKSNKLKQYFTQKITGLATTSHNIILSTLKDEGERLNNELKSRYKKTIQKSKEEIERQSQLVSKLRKHNRQLYSVIQKTKKENEDKVVNLEKNLQDLKMTIKRLKEKNDYLHTHIKLEVEGCQNDIYDARKKIRKLIKP